MSLVQVQIRCHLRLSPIQALAICEYELSASEQARWAKKQEVFMSALDEANKKAEAAS